MKAKTLYICTFTLAQTDNIDSFPALDRHFYEAAVMGTSELIFQDGFKDMDGNVLTSACSFQNPNFQDFLKVANAPAPPFVAIIGEFPDGQKRLYITKSPQQVKNLIKQMWLGEFGGTTPMPTNLGDGEGGWGEGSSVLCKIFPPLCALGFLPWLVLAGIATYKTAESRSTLGKATWGIPAALLWLGFFERGGVKQIQWWVKKAGIGAPLSNKAILHILRSKYGNLSDWFQPFNNSPEGYFSLADQLWQDGLLERKDVPIEKGGKYAGSRIYFRKKGKKTK